MPVRPLLPGLLLPGLPLPSLLLLSLILLGTAAHAQGGDSAGRRVDVLTGEPARPRAAPRPEPQIFNAPHAPRQAARGPEDGPPIEVYIAPQIGTGSDGLFSNNGMPMGRPIRRQ